MSGNGLLSMGKTEKCASRIKNAGLLMLYEIVLILRIDVSIEEFKKTNDSDANAANGNIRICMEQFCQCVKEKKDDKLEKIKTDKGI